MLSNNDINMQNKLLSLAMEIQNLPYLKKGKNERK